MREPDSCIAVEVAVWKVITYLSAFSTDFWQMSYKTKNSVYHFSHFQLFPVITESQNKDEKGSSEAGIESSSDVLLHLPSNLRGHSRLDQEYVILELLGQGGFGHVFKVHVHM